jgi:hypothetical protein
LLNIALTLITIFAFTFFSGLGIFSLLAPAYLRRGSLYIVLVPGLGLLQVAIIDGFLISSSRGVAESIALSAIVGAVTIAVSLAVEYVQFRKRGETSVRAYAGHLVARVRERLAALRALFSTRGAILFVTLCALLYPALRANMPTTPFRVGIDQVGYGETAQYLVEGGTLRAATGQLLTQLHTSDLKKAKAHNGLALNFETYVRAEFLLKALRWSFPGMLATLTILTGSDHVYRVEFIALIFSYALTLALVNMLLRRWLGVTALVAILVTTVFALNANIINTYYEGQLGEVFAEPYLLLLLMTFLDLRTSGYGLGVQQGQTSDFTRSCLFFGLVLGFMFFTYNEALVLVFAFFALVLLLDVTIVHRLQWRATLCLLGGSAIGFCIAFPISGQWIQYTFANLSGLSRAGFWQPHWASLAEIIGIFNMYGSTPYVLIARSSANEAANVVLSVAIACLLLRLFITDRKIDTAFWCAAPIMILAIYWKTKYHDGILNYPYMKVYTLAAPLLVCATFAAVHNAYRDTGRKYYAAVQFAMLLAIAVSGISYIATYVMQGSFVTNDMFSLYEFDGTRRFDDVTVETEHSAPSIKDFMLVPLLSMNFLNESDMPKYVAPFLSRPFVVLLWTSDLLHPDVVAAQWKSRVVFQNSSVLALLIDQHLADVCAPNADAYTLDDLGYDPLVTWQNLPASECDFSYGKNLLLKLNS